MATLIKTLRRRKRLLGWVVDFKGIGNVLVMRKTPQAIVGLSRLGVARTTERDEAGFSIDPSLYRVLYDYNIQRVVFWVKRTGWLYHCPATSYMDSETSKMVKYTRNGKRQRAVLISEFTKERYQIKL